MEKAKRGREERHRRGGGVGVESQIGVTGEVSFSEEENFGFLK